MLRGSKVRSSSSNKAGVHSRKKAVGSYNRLSSRLSLQAQPQGDVSTID